MIDYILEFNCKDNKIEINECYSEDSGIYLRRLIKKLHDKNNPKVVVLIDEYDKPILDNKV